MSCPRVTVRLAALLFSAMLLAGCQGSEPLPTRPLLTGRAVLPADTFAEGPATGSALEGPVNGRTPPFAGVPVQGFSSLLADSAGTYLALSDNGFGARTNSADYPLRWYRLQLDLEAGKPHGGPVTVLDHITLTDPDTLVPFPLVLDTPGRVLHGGDFDPESFVRLEDGTFWVGDEFGPYLLHFDAAGRLLEKPVPVPVAPPLRPYGRGSYVLRSPDHPQLRLRPDDRPVDELANLPGSGGVEGLARDPRSGMILVLVEKSLAADPRQQRRSLQEFDSRTGRFTGRFWFLRAETPTTCLTSLEALGRGRFLVLERDLHEGERAVIKRVYAIDLARTDAEGFLVKTLVCDLLDIRDNLGFSRAEDGATGLGADYAFPYVTPESLLILDARTLLLVNDNNYPFSSGRRPGLPDDSEFIRLQLPAPLLP